VAITILTDPKTRQPKLRLVLPDDIHDGPVSVVGSFNDWTPGRHRLVRRANGTRSVTVPVTPGQQLRFRYLGSGGRWFDDPDAERIETDGGVVGVVEV
jgi:1,4-alpha-glucan branching enzyme